MKISVFVATSLDGFIARKKGELDWLPDSQGAANTDYGYSALLESVQMLVMGRRTFEFVNSLETWPYGEIPVLVLSTTMKRLPASAPETVRLQSGAPNELDTELQRAGINHIYLDGGQTIQNFLNAGLALEITITRIPVLLGQGIPLFGPLKQDIRLRHLETVQFSNGLVQSKYEVIK